MQECNYGSHFSPFYIFCKKQRILSPLFCKKQRIGAMTVRSHPWSSSQRWVSVGIAFLAPLLFVSCLALYLVYTSTYSTIYTAEESKRWKLFGAWAKQSELGPQSGASLWNRPQHWTPDSSLSHLLLCGTTWDKLALKWKAMN